MKFEAWVRLDTRAMNRGMATYRHLNGHFYDLLHMTNTMLESKKADEKITTKKVEEENRANTDRPGG